MAPTLRPFLRLGSWKLGGGMLLSTFTVCRFLALVRLTIDGVCRRLLRIQIRCLPNSSPYMLRIPTPHCNQLRDTRLPFLAHRSSFVTNISP